ncbi:MAG TPA: ester cyclase [Gemmatimonadaceae bacterium]
MSAQENARIARIPYEAFNTRHFDDAAAAVADDFEMRNMATGEIFRGPNGIKKALQQWADAFPDGKAEIRSVIADENGAVVEFMGHGTNTGPLATPAGTLPATNRTADLPFCDVVTIRNGKIATTHEYLDMSTMLRQLGFMPEAAGAGTAGAGAYAK